MQQNKFAFSLVERPLKLIFNDYFESFLSLENIDHLPKIYLDYLKLIRIQRQLPSSFWTHTGLSIPSKTGNLRFEGFSIKSQNIMKVNGVIYWDVVSQKTTWDLETVDQFVIPAQQEQIKHMIGSLFPIARFVFKTLKEHYPILSYLELDTDEENLSLFLRDTYFNQILDKKLIPSIGFID